MIESIVLILSLVLSAQCLYYVRMLSVRASKWQWVAAYALGTIYPAMIVLELLFSPATALGGVGLVVHLVVLSLLLAVVLVEGRAWHRPNAPDHAPPESDRAPLGAR